VAIKYLKVQDYCPQKSNKVMAVVFGWKIVQNLRIRIFPESFSAAMAIHKIGS
jgi:hypothetical protein